MRCTATIAKTQAIYFLRELLEAQKLNHRNRALLRPLHKPTADAPDGRGQRASTTRFQPPARIFLIKAPGIVVRPDCAMTARVALAFSGEAEADDRVDGAAPPAIGDTRRLFQFAHLAMHDASNPGAGLARAS